MDHPKEQACSLNKSCVPKQWWWSIISLWEMYVCVVNNKYMCSLAWPDPLCPGAYRLEIVSARQLVYIVNNRYFTQSELIATVHSEI